MTAAVWEAWPSELRSGLRVLINGRARVLDDVGDDNGYLVTATLRDVGAWEFPSRRPVRVVLPETA